MPTFFKVPQRRFNPSSEEDLNLAKTSFENLNFHRQRLKVLDNLGQTSALVALVSSPLAHIRIPLAGKLCTLAMCSLWGTLAMRYERHQMFLAEAETSKQCVNWVLKEDIINRLRHKSHPEWQAQMLQVTDALGAKRATEGLASSLPYDVQQQVDDIDRKRLPFNFTPLENNPIHAVDNASRDYLGYLNQMGQDAIKILEPWFKLCLKMVALEKDEKAEKEEEATVSRKRKN